MIAARKGTEPGLQIHSGNQATGGTPVLLRIR